ncbi:MAG: DHH family phosphoesterase [Spirochaetaceae bacterium]
MKGIQELISHIDPAREVAIQAHDFPDHDAVGTAYALSRLLASNQIETKLCYGGEIQSASLTEMIRILEIPIMACHEAELADDAQIIIVDGFVGNTNIRGVPGEVIGVIDHHVPPTEPNCKYYDIRPHFGACSTILYEYYKISNNEMEANVATGLLIGVMMDTAFMTRGVAPVDLEAFSSLFFSGDWQTGSRLLKNSLSLADLSVFREAINACIVADDFCFVPVTKECTQEVMALVADFFLGLREIHFVVVLEPEREEYRISVRSEDNARPTDVIIKKALQGMGSGGGHVYMGGGSIPRDLFPGDEVLRKRFMAAMGKG